MTFNATHEETTWLDNVMPAYSDDIPNFIDDNGGLICGIYTGLDNETYHSLDAINSSIIKKLVSKTPAHAKKILDEKESSESLFTRSRAMEIGTLGHELILEPNEFEKKYFRLPNQSEHPKALVTSKELANKCDEVGLAKTGNKPELIERLAQHDMTIEIFDLIVASSYMKNTGKKAFQIAQELVRNKKAINIHKAYETQLVKKQCLKLPVEVEQWNKAKQVESAFLKHTRAPLLTKDGFPEITMIAKDPITGLLLKIKIDYLRRDAIAIDIKTARSAEPYKFSKQCKDLNYDVQAEFYKYVANLLDVPVEVFAFVAIEYEEAEICEIFELSKKRQEQGWRDTEMGLRTLKGCIDTSNWYGYTVNDQIIVID
ncbi:PD-(D/E)XK nuclease-like domain-containing protein (plasmid) [Psychrobium sp. nBUS_13]|uniref:PD-(D/E)XK nuclease-like domain-containing protein n=1 Tax=Psychrobium sp. nBUS_13 TaxID=3395319 RepID=UPI003EB7BD5C